MYLQRIDVHLKCDLYRNIDKGAPRLRSLLVLSLKSRGWYIWPAARGRHRRWKQHRLPPAPPPYLKLKGIKLTLGKLETSIQHNRVIMNFPNMCFLVDSSSCGMEWYLGLMVVKTRIGFDN